MCIITTKKYLKSPLNYVGGKHKLLPQIEPLFPKDIGTFVDLFAGGGNVGINVKAEKVIFNDTEEVVVNLLKDWSCLDVEDALSTLQTTIQKYGLSKENESGFKQIREDYNDGHKSWDMFYAMVTNAFNYQIRFNKSGGYNMPFGRNRSWFNPALEKHFVSFLEALDDKIVDMTCKDFRDYSDFNYSLNDFVYCDPPYLITTAAYNENGGWTEEDERDLLNFLDGLHNKSIRFALSNVLESKGRINEILKSWSSKYTVHYLDKNYTNSNYQRKDNGKKDVEVLITNY